MKARTLIQLAAMATIVLAGAASAQLPTVPSQVPVPTQVEPDLRGLRPAPGQPISDANAFKVLDVDGDGAISAAEWRERKMAIFSLLDANADLSLERSEVPRLAAELFDAADADKDGKLSGFEYNQAVFVRYETLDVDRDDAVTFVEFQQYRRGLAGD